jgi:hypothetical protein
MRNASTQSPAAPQRFQPESWRSGDGARWTASIAIAAAAIALLFMAVVRVPAASINANNNLCLQQIANDEHTSLEAFFQNPAEQDAFVQAITVCSR